VITFVLMLKEVFIGGHWFIASMVFDAARAGTFGIQFPARTYDGLRPQIQQQATLADLNFSSRSSFSQSMAIIDRGTVYQLSVHSHQCLPLAHGSGPCFTRSFGRADFLLLSVALSAPRPSRLR
jgi:hypothetical protein